MAIDFSNSDFDSEELEPLVTTSLTREDEGEYSLRPKTGKIIPWGEEEFLNVLEKLADQLTGQNN